MVTRCKNGRLVVGGKQEEEGRKGLEYKGTINQKMLCKSIKFTFISCKRRVVSCNPILCD